MRKCKIMILALLLGTAHGAFAQWEVTDPLLLSQQLIELARLGDPAAIKTLAGLGELKEGLGSPGSGLSLNKLQKIADGLKALAYDGNGLFMPIPDRIITPDGTEIRREEKEYRKYDAITQTTDNFKEVQKETEGRRLELRSQLRDTVSQAQVATTQAEVDKLKIVVAAQGNELNALNLEHAEAVDRVLVQDIENRNDKEKQQLATTEEAAAAFKSASDKVAGFLKPDTRSALIPAPATAQR